jgi:hypothetical protein
MSAPLGSVLSRSDGFGASSIIALTSANAPQEYDFSVAPVPGSRLVVTPDGGIDDVISRGGVTYAIGHVDRPWAVDARDRDVPTWFSVEGTTLTQHIDTTGASFPVAADPHYTWGWVSGTVYFNKTETWEAYLDINFLFGVATLAPWPFNVVIAFYVGAANRMASQAVHDGQCLKIKSNGRAYEYSGGYCR